jgi:hypothetical protein
MTEKKIIRRRQITVPIVAYAIYKWVGKPYTDHRKNWRETFLYYHPVLGYPEWDNDLYDVWRGSLEDDVEVLAVIPAPPGAILILEEREYEDHDASLYPVRDVVPGYVEGEWEDVSQ